MRLLLAFILLINCALAGAQFTYFNQITGELDDENSESVANIEVVDDGYVVWGGGVDSTGQQIKLTRKYDFEGDILNQNIHVFEDEYFYSGIINSFQWNPYTEEFVLLQGSDTGPDVKGRMLTFDANLELQDDLYFDNYAPYTYFFGFLIEPDGYVIYGELGADPNSQGTFIMKLNFEGDTLWSEIMQPEVYQDIYRNNTIVSLEPGYLIGGGRREGLNDIGLLTRTNSMGQTQSEVLIADSSAESNSFAGVLKLINGEILVSQSISYDTVDEIPSPGVYWNKLRLYKYNPNTEEIYWQQDYHDDYEFIQGGVSDWEATPDGGAIISGGYFGFSFDVYGWMMKIDEDGNEEWYHDYTYETCDDCSNYLLDVELAPDGGYIAAGYFANYDIDPRNATWLLKIDACGNVEWQGCDALGFQEQEAKQFKVYPNPNRGHFTVETKSQARASSWALYDLMGRQVARGNVPGQNTQFGVAVDVSSGLYTLRLYAKSGTLQETHRIELAK